MLPQKTFLGISVGYESFHMAVFLYFTAGGFLLASGAYSLIDWLAIKVYPSLIIRLDDTAIYRSSIYGSEEVTYDSIQKVKEFCGRKEKLEMIHIEGQGKRLVLHDVFEGHDKIIPVLNDRLKGKTNVQWIRKDHPGFARLLLYIPILLAVVTLSNLLLEPYWMFVLVPIFFSLVAGCTVLVENPFYQRFGILFKKVDRLIGVVCIFIACNISVPAILMLWGKFIR